VAAVAAPTSAGFLIGHDMPVTYVVTLLLGSAAFGVLALRMERVLPPVANGLHVDPADLAGAEGLNAGAPSPAASS
jgi:hypothetical protein